MDGSESFATVAAGGNNREPAPPTWDGSDPAVNYQVFEKNVRYWQYESELDKKKQGVRLLRGLTGLARASVDSLEFDQVATEKGVENIMKRLQEEFAPHLEVSLPRAFEKAIYGQPRSHKETMQEYLLRADRAFFMLTKEGVTLPDAAVGYVLYRQASLTESQDLRFSAWAQGKYDRATVTTCLRKLDKVVAEKSKSSGTFLQEEDGDGSEHEAYPVEFEDQKDEDQFVYVEEGDMDKIYDEDEIQIVLATYQEVRKAIQSSQKGRRFWKGKGRGSPGQDFFKNKKKIHIEQLKLRTRCARCGNIGHWAKECKNEPDGKGKSYQGSTASSVKAPSSAGQSWYVSTGSDGCSNSILDTNFGVWCRGDCTENEVLGTHHVDKGDFSFHEDEPLDGQLRGSETVFRGPKGLVFEKGHDGPCCLFIGLTTSPSTAVVDTAAQDGLIGRPALERLKQQLGAIGLRISWTKKKAKAHGVGGPAKVIGIAAIPLGLAGTTGILETTVVENDVPLLLPVTLLGSLQAVIDVRAEKMLFRRLDRTVDLIRLPSGHLAVDVLNFGTEGYKHPIEAIHAGLDESDFRCGSGSEVGDTTMFLQLHDRASLSGHVGSLGAVSTCFQSASRRCTYGPCGAPQTQFEASNSSVEASLGQGLLSSTTHWIGRIGELMASTGLGGPEAFPIVLQAVRRVRGHRGVHEAFAREDCSNQDGCRMSTPSRTTDHGRQSVRLVGDLLGLSQQVEGTAVLRSGDQEGQGEVGSYAGEFSRGVQESAGQGADCKGDQSGVRGEVPSSCEEAQRGCTADQVGGTEERGSSPVRTSRGCQDGSVERHHDERVCRDVGGQDSLRGAQGLLRRRDVRHGREEACFSRGDAGFDRTTEGVPGDPEPDDGGPNAGSGQHTWCGVDGFKSEERPSEVSLTSCDKEAERRRRKREDEGT